MTEAEVLRIAQRIGTTGDGSPIVWIDQAPGERILLSNSGEFLVDPAEAARLIPLLKEYVRAMNSTDVQQYNEWLLDQRDKEQLAYRDKGRQQTEVRQVRSIYLMYNARNGLYKIGIARDPFFREKTLQAEEPEIELVFQAPGTAGKERELHARFDHKRVRGEWFRLEEQDITDIKTLLS